MNRNETTETENAKLRKLSRWIPVAEQLPPERSENDLVLAWHVGEKPWRGAGKPTGVYVARVVLGYWYDSAGAGDGLVNVTHWQPLPSPPVVPDARPDDGRPLADRIADVTIAAGEAPTAERPVHLYIEPEPLPEGSEYPISVARRQHRAMPRVWLPVG